MIRTFLPSLALFLIAAPTLADEAGTTDVSFEIQIAAPTAETLASIDAQAWEACAPTPGSASVFDRSPKARRACQDDLVREVVSELSNPELSAALQARDATDEG